MFKDDAKFVTEALKPVCRLFNVGNINILLHINGRIIPYNTLRKPDSANQQFTLRAKVLKLSLLSIASKL